MRRLTSAAAVLLVICTICLVCGGCGRLLRRTPSTSTAAKQVAEPEVGPARAVVVIDCSESVISKFPMIKEAVEIFCQQAARNREFDLAVIRLDSFPMDPLVVKNSEFTEERWNSMLKTFSETEGVGKGTDQVTAMKKAVEAAQGDGDAVPEAVVLLYFSDMIVDQPSGSRGQFRGWDQFEWGKLNEANISDATFYVIRMANPKADSHSRAVYRQQEETISQLKSKAKAAQVNARFIYDRVLEDELAKGRFKGPSFD